MSSIKTPVSLGPTDTGPGIPIFDPDGRLIARIGTEPVAREIARVLNTHARLVEAARGLILVAREMHASGPGGFLVSDLIPLEIDELNIALRKATGGKS